MYRDRGFGFNGTEHTSPQLKGLISLDECELFSVLLFTVLMQLPLVLDLVLVEYSDRQRTHMGLVG